jgi:predicted Zn-dependent protease with MMP-like domain
MYDVLSEREWERVDQVWDLLDEAEIERARIEANDLLRQRPNHPDLLVLDAAIAIEEGRPDAALNALRGAERSADPALLFHLRALARFQRAEFEAARTDAEKAIAIRPQLAESHAVLSRVHEFLGDEEAAARHAEIAADMDPEACPLPMVISDEEFDRLVESALTELPPAVREHLGEIPVIVEPLPSRELLVADDPPLAPDILGLFTGPHLMGRRHDDLPAAPPTITLFRRNLLRACRDRDELAREVRITVQHEVGHYLGLDEDELDRWGLA